MSSLPSYIENFIQIINLGISIAIILYAIRIYNSTDNNPLDIPIFVKPSIENLTVPYTTPPPNQISNYLAKNCQCEELILCNICTEEQIISGFSILQKKWEHFT